MTARIEDLPPGLLDRVMHAFIDASHEDARTALTGLGPTIHESACRRLFADLTLPDDVRLFRPSTSSFLLPIPHNPASAFISNSQRYGPYVRTLRFSDPLVFSATDTSPSTNLGIFGDFEVIEEEDDEDSDEVPREKAIKGEHEVAPLDSDMIDAVLTACPNLEEVVWTGQCPPPEAFCEYLSTSNVRLRWFTYAPTASRTKHHLPKWDAPSLPLLASFSSTLTSLTLTRLTHQGAKSFSHLLNTLAEDELSASSLESLDIDFVWLDDALCGRIVAAGKKLSRLKIGTRGTKLTDTGIVALLEGLESLVNFSLFEVEGRLSKSLWSKLDSVTPTLRRFTIGISEAGPAHSWSLDHLQSLSSFPLQQITHFNIVRTSSSSVEPRLPDTISSIPSNVLNWMQEAGGDLTSLVCDWWGFSPDDLKGLLEHCPKLESIRIAFDAPMTKFLALGSSVASPIRLAKVSLVIPSDHLPSPPPSPSIATPGLTPASSPLITTNARVGTTPLRTPSALPPSPATPYSSLRRDSMNKGVLNGTYFEPASPSVGGRPSSQVDGSPLASIRSVPLLGPVLPLLRDVKKLYKRCSQLRQVEWVGRGTWILDPSSKSTTAKTISLANIQVEFIPPPPLSDAEWEAQRKEDEIAKWRWVPNPADRAGQTWEGEAADQLAQERDALFPEKEKKEEKEAPEVNAKRKASSNALASSPTVSRTPLPADTPKKGSGKHRRGSATESNAIAPSYIVSPSVDDTPPKSGSPRKVQVALPPATPEKTRHRPRSNTASADGQKHSRQRSASGSAMGNGRPNERRDPKPTRGFGGNGRRPSATGNPNGNVPTTPGY